MEIHGISWKRRGLYQSSMGFPWKFMELYGNDVVVHGFLLIALQL